MLIYLLFVLMTSAITLAVVFAARVVLAKRIARSARYRGLFQFSDGVNLRAVDPISVIEAMEAHEQYRFDIHPQQVAEGDKEAIGITVDAVRKAFAVPAFTKVGVPGLTNNECLQLLNAFSLWVAAQKKSTDQPST